MSTAEYMRGALCGLAAASIWAGWIVVARLGLRTSLTPWDIAALRFSVGGLLLLPYLLRKGFAIERLGWIGLAAVVLDCGAPMVLLVNAGLLFAPAAHAGGLFSGVVPLIVVLLAALILHEAFTSAKRVGLVLILAGVIGIVWSAGGTIGTRQNIGHVLFIAGALLWACYTVAMRGARLDGLHAAAIAAVGTLVLYLPIYAVVAGASLFKAALTDIALQAFVRGYCPRSLRARRQHPWSFRRCGIPRPVPGADRGAGHSDPRRVADGYRLDRHHFNFCRRLRCKRRPAAWTTDVKAAPTLTHSRRRPVR
jgi:drug/metabolite transporter (DMT)-like permease